MNLIKKLCDAADDEGRRLVSLCVCVSACHLQAIPLGSQDVELPFMSSSDLLLCVNLPSQPPEASADDKRAELWMRRRLQCLRASKHVCCSSTAMKYGLVFVPGA